MKLGTGTGIWIVTAPIKMSWDRHSQQNTKMHKRKALGRILLTYAGSTLHSSGIINYNPTCRFLTGASALPSCNRREHPPSPRWSLHRHAEDKAVGVDPEQLRLFVHLWFTGMRCGSIVHGQAVPITTKSKHRWPRTPPTPCPPECVALPQYTVRLSSSQLNRSTGGRGAIFPLVTYSRHFYLFCFMSEHECL